MIETSSMGVERPMVLPKIGCPCAFTVPSNSINYNLQVKATSVSFEKIQPENDGIFEKFVAVVKYSCFQMYVTKKCILFGKPLAKEVDVFSVTKN